jgi:hypothetical protein
MELSVASGALGERGSERERGAQGASAASEYRITVRTRILFRMSSQFKQLKQRKRSVVQVRECWNKKEVQLRLAHAAELTCSGRI